MNRTNNCGELTKSNLGQTVKLSGWVNKIREKGFIIWVDLRDRYGITQLVFDKERSNDEIFTTASQLGRERTNTTTAAATYDQCNHRNRKPNDTKRKT
jgi:aspartyl-tRNA synthetase